MSTMPHIFLSYSRDDQAIARAFAEGFKSEGFDVWWDATLKSGETYDEVTERAFMRAARRTADFKQFARDYGLYDYWRSSGRWGDFARPIGNDDFEIVG